MIAHASGFSWDEALLILVPIAVIVLLLAVARRRATSGTVPTEEPDPSRTPSGPGRPAG